MRKAIISFAAIAATVGATPIQAQEGTRVYQRDGSWSLEAGEDVCRLAHMFSDGETQIAFALERNRADNSARLILISDAIRTFRSADQIGYSFQPANDERSAMYIRADTEDGRTYYNLGTIFLTANPFAGFGPDAPPYDRAAEVEFAGGITSIEFSQGLLEPIRLETGSLRAPIQALQACADDLIHTWGLDWEKHQTMTRRAAPVGEAWQWIPSGLVGFGDFGSLSGARNPFRVMVDAAGNPTGCHVHWPSLPDRKNEQVCEAIMENGEFTPALDADGQPMASYWMVEYFPSLSRPFRGR